MKIGLTILLFLFCVASLYSQAIENAQSFELRYGKTFSVGGYASLRYRTTTSTTLDISFAAFINSLQRNGLQYYSYGIDVMGEYYTGVGDNTDHLFELKACAGATAMVDNEPFVLHDVPFLKRINYGLVGELAGEWSISQNIALTLFGQQKLLFNKTLGRTSFTIGLGLKLSLD